MKKSPISLLAIIAILLLVLLGSLGFLLLKNKNKTADTTNQNSSLPTFPGSEEPDNGQPKTKYDTDTNNNGIPNFVETAAGYDPNVDTCLVDSCGLPDKDTQGNIANVVFMMDSSGSMAETLNGATKMETAKAELNKLAEQIPSNVGVGLGIFGHKGSNSDTDKAVSCASADEVYPISDIDINTFKSKVNSFQPVGWTPLGNALRKGGDIVKTAGGSQNVIVLITDGIETCDSNPLGAIEELKAQGIDVTIHVIGFDIAASDTASLQQIAQAGGGQYFNATDAQSFQNTLKYIRDLLKSLQCQQSSVNEYLACVNKRADASVTYLRNLNQSVYSDYKDYNGVTAIQGEDTNDLIAQAQTKINEYRNAAGTRFAELQKQVSGFLGEVFEEQQ
ncbi:MAG: VWA domain-containing protein [Weeksellaceae bacterium]